MYSLWPKYCVFIEPAILPINEINSLRLSTDENIELIAKKASPAPKVSTTEVDKAGEKWTDLLLNILNKLLHSMRFVYAHNVVSAPLICAGSTTQSSSQLCIGTLPLCIVWDAIGRI